MKPFRPMEYTAQKIMAATIKRHNPIRNNRDGSRKIQGLNVSV